MHKASTLGKRYLPLVTDLTDSLKSTSRCRCTAGRAAAPSPGTHIRTSSGRIACRLGRRPHPQRAQARRGRCRRGRGRQIRWWMRNACRDGMSERGYEEVWMMGTKGTARAQPLYPRLWPVWCHFFSLIPDVRTLAAMSLSRSGGPLFA